MLRETSHAVVQDALAKAVADELQKQYAKAVEPTAPQRSSNAAQQELDEEEVSPGRFLTRLPWSGYECAGCVCNVNTTGTMGGVIE